MAMQVHYRELGWRRTLFFSDETDRTVVVIWRDVPPGRDRSAEMCLSSGVRIGGELSQGWVIERAIRFITAGV